MMSTDVNAKLDQIDARVSEINKLKNQVIKEFKEVLKDPAFDNEENDEAAELAEDLRDRANGIAYDLDGYIDDAEFWVNSHC